MTKYVNGYKVTCKEWGRVIKVYSKDDKGRYTILIKAIEVDDYIKAVMMIKSI